MGGGKLENYTLGQLKIFNLDMKEKSCFHFTVM